MSRFSVVYDACVLYPAPLRDLLMHLAVTGLFHARWTDEIHDEWISSLLRDRPDLTAEQLARTRSLMNACVLDCLVTDYQEIQRSLVLPDAGDCHILAAAIKCRASAIITFNLRDFPESALRPLGIEAQHPDDFIMRLLELDTAAVCEAVKRQRATLKNPPMTVELLLEKLQQQQLPATVASLRRYAPLL